METPHRILQDNLLAGGNKERVEELSKLASQVQEKYTCGFLCFALVLHVIYVVLLYSGSGVVIFVALFISTDFAKCRCELVLQGVWLMWQGVEVLCSYELMLPVERGSPTLLTVLTNSIHLLASQPLPKSNLMFFSPLHLSAPSGCFPVDQ